MPSTNGRTSPPTVPSHEFQVSQSHAIYFDASRTPILNPIFEISGNTVSVFDISHNPILSIHDASGDVVSSISDSSGTVFSISSEGLCNDVSWNMVLDGSGHAHSVIYDGRENITFTPIITDASVSIVHGAGYEITTTTGFDGSSNITQVIFNTTDPSNYNPIIYENLVEKVTTYDDTVDASGQAELLLKQIQTYAGEINCSDFHGKGTIDDYTALFQAASKIATDSKQMELEIDIEGFNEFGAAADELAQLFQGFIMKLQNVNIITDITFLTAISTALGKIVNLSKIFGKFKEAVIDTTTIQIPKSAHQASLIISDVMDEVNCAMQYINYFVDPSSNPNLGGAQLTTADKNIITQAVNTVENWNTLCEYGVSIAMSTDPDVISITAASNELKTQTTSLKNAANKLKSKLSAFNIC